MDTAITIGTVYLVGVFLTRLACLGADFNTKTDPKTTKKLARKISWGWPVYLIIVLCGDRVD